ncbi:hypothetical protein BWR18_13355 [Tateyamaria omphalii]|uniref:Uncharacterized protein n=1 Tax=Tateyamaria omphalii TaxID=299262 RepID=A0A1P8MWU0_9RHOB|nr:hypothetical protein BWR18_13355 [Tateyamaria omphalii]
MGFEKMDAGPDGSAFFLSRDGTEGRGSKNKGLQGRINRLVGFMRRVGGSGWAFARWGMGIFTGCRRMTP